MAGSRPDWHALSRQHGPQRPPVRERDLAPPLPPSVCGRCGRAMKVPALVTRRGTVLCGRCAPYEPEPHEPPLVCGKRIEELVWQATRLYERLKARRALVTEAAGWTVEDRQYAARWFTAYRHRADDLDRAIAAAYRRFWRRKKLWLTQ